MTKNEIKKMVNTCNNYYSCALCPYNPEDISRFIGDRWKGGCPDYDRKLVYAMGKGYGNVSEYKTERKMLRSQIKVLKQRLNDKYIEIDNLKRDYSNAFERLKSQQQEIERLKTENCELTKKLEARLTCDFVKTAQKQAQIDVLNRLKSSSIYDDNYLDGYVFLDDINNIIEELEK